ncbi:hypothetical protein LUZ60_004787 [Juncus effusus]|nr:hypothetical protein LUZ60_004787 [Juncus effusus]
MKLTIILSLLSLSLLSTLSLCVAEQPPVDYLCNFIEQNVTFKGHCFGVFSSYPTIRQATYQGVALIANNVAKQRLKTVITSMKRYQSTPNIPTQQKQGVASCLDLMRDLNQALEDAVDLIMKRQYQHAVNIERMLVKKIKPTCDFRAEAPIFVMQSFSDFLMADAVAYKAILILRPKNHN